MRKLFIFIIIFILVSSFNLIAQSPGRRNIGFGVMLGDPTGLTLKIWTPTNNAFVIDLGSSYFGSPRINVDYLWHFNAFHSNTVNLYAGPGAALGFGKGHGIWYDNTQGFYVRNNNAGLGVRGVFGVDFVPQNNPLEFFFELGVLVGLAPDFGSAVDAAIGMRFYP